MRSAEMTSPQIGEAARANALVLVPLGQTEEHGPHLPTGTDAMIADAVAAGIEQALDGEMPVVVLDTVRYGYSVKAVANWPGTITTSCAPATSSARLADTGISAKLITGWPSADTRSISNKQLPSTSRLRACKVPATSSISCVRKT